ncbi:ABC transporter substrate-binding protein [Desulfobacterales bacterium HSG17]|nr:ABC transporter substrate-binding protein [Desulfobacterales bacterium HSG17]
MRQGVRFLSLAMFVLFLGLNVYAAGEPYKILAPPTPSSIPLLLAADKFDTLRVEIFLQHSRAHARFLNGEVKLLNTGITVGRTLYDQGAPIKIVNSHVAGITYLVTNQKGVDHFVDLKGKTIHLPFKGSPIDDITQFFIRRSGLEWDQEIKIKYRPFQATVKSMLNGSMDTAVLPEPFISHILMRADANQGFYIAFAYMDMWQQLTGSPDGYPQVGLFGRTDFLLDNEALVKSFNRELAVAIDLVQTDPQLAIRKTAGYFKFQSQILQSALKRTRFKLWVGQELTQAVQFYDDKLKPTDETTRFPTDFFFH